MRNQRTGSSGRAGLGRPPAALAAVAVAAAAAAALPSPAGAAIQAPTAWTRGGGTSTYQAWDVFSSPAGPNAPDLPGRYPAAGTYAGALVPNAIDSSGASFVTSGGNIYSFSGPTHIEVDTPGYNTGLASVTTALFQTRTQGTEPVYDGPNRPRVSYQDATGTHIVYPSDVSPRSVTPLGGFGGNLVDAAYLFLIPADPASMRFFVDASESSMSLDQVYVDTVVRPAAEGYAIQPVPEPAAAGVVGLGLVGLLARRRRRKGA